jgi:hypothetical protein
MSQNILEFIMSLAEYFRARDVMQQTFKKMETSCDTRVCVCVHAHARVCVFI